MTAYELGKYTDLTQTGARKILNKETKRPMQASLEQIFNYLRGKFPQDLLFSVGQDAQVAQVKTKAQASMLGIDVESSTRFRYALSIIETGQFDDKQKNELIELIKKIMKENEQYRAITQHLSNVTTIL